MLSRRVRPFPSRSSLRWLVRLGFALPLIAAAVITHVFGAPIEGTPNALLLERVSMVSWDRADPAWLGQIYPPGSTLLAYLVPGDRLGLAIVGAIAGGIVLQKLLEIMLQRSFHISTAAILMVALAANPVFFYLATEDIASFLGLMFFGLAVSDMVRFVTWRDTRSGFRAGLLLMSATLVDLMAIVYVLAALLTIPFVRSGRAEQPGSRWSNALVLTYPTASALVSLMALNFIFLGNPFGSVAEAIASGVLDRLLELPAWLVSVDGTLAVAPVLSAWLVAIIVGRWKSIPISALVFAALLLGRVLGLEQAGSVGTSFIMMTVLAMALIPTAKRLVTNMLLDAVAVVQIAIAWLIAFTNPYTLEWMASLQQAFFGLPG
ncbi:MAG: hypothetical protein ACOH1J_03150 [Microbacteriaceae bacterium]